MISRIRSITGQSAIYGLGNLLPKAIGFILIPLYTNFLTPADYGILYFVTSLLGIMSIFLELGLGNTITRFHYDYLQDKREQRAFYGTVWLSLHIFSLIATLLLIWQGENLFRSLFREVPFQPYGWLVLCIAFVNITSIIPLALFRVREQANYYITFTVGRFLLNTLAIIYYVSVLRLGAEGSLRGQLLSAIIFSIPFTLVSLLNLDLRFDVNKLRASLAYGLPLIAHQLAGWALSVSDRLLLERYVSLTELGLYSLGYRFASILDLLLSSFNMAWAPFFFRTAKEEKNAPRIFAQLTTYYAIVVLFLALGISACAREVLVLVANPAFWDAYTVIPVVVLAGIANGAYFITVNSLFYTKKTNKLPVFTGFAAITNVTLNMILLPKWGILGAAWTTVISYLISATLVFREARRIYPIPYEFKRLAVLFTIVTPLYVLGVSIRFETVFVSLIFKLLLVFTFPLLLYVFHFFTTRELTGMRLALAQTFAQMQNRMKNNR